MSPYSVAAIFKASMTPPSTSFVVGVLKTRVWPEPSDIHRSVKVPPTSVPTKKLTADDLSRFGHECLCGSSQTQRAEGAEERLAVTMKPKLWGAR